MKLSKSLENTEKIRIIIGISTNKEAIKFIQKAELNKQFELQFSHAEVKQVFENTVAEEMENNKKQWIR